MRVLVTGGAGFIGSHIVDALLSEGHLVSVIDDLSMGSPENLNPKARLHQVSITDSRGVDDVFAEERPQLVSHHAAQTDVRRSMAEPLFDITVNVLGTINLLESARKNGTSKFVFASSSTVYAEPEYIPMDESHPIQPQSAYGMSKHTAEAYIRFYGSVHGLRFTIFRYGNVYGPRQDPKGEAGVVSIFSGQFLNGITPTIFGDGSKTRDYIFVSDIVNANIGAMADVGDDEVFNIGWGQEVSDYEIFEAVRKATGADLSPVYSPKRPGEADRVSLDVSKARATLRWGPKVHLEEGIEQSVSYYLDRLR